MKKKKVALTIASVAMVGALTVGGTLAYLTAMTEEVTNVFTGDNSKLKGIIDEKFDKEKAESFLPGDVITKAPNLVNKSESLSSWVAVKVSIEDTTNGGDSIISYNDFTSKYGTIQSLKDGKYVDGFNTNDFAVIGGGEDQDYIVFMYNDILDANKATPNIFDQVTVSAGIKKVFSKSTSSKKVYEEIYAEDYKDGDSNYLKKDGKYYVLVDTSSATVDEAASYFYYKDGQMVEADDATILPSFNIDVKGYMVQSDNVDKDTAKSALLDLVAENK